MGYVDNFIQFLVENHNYNKSTIVKSTYRYDGRKYGRVEVMHNGMCIQAFVLMSEKHLRSLETFPFYRTYYQHSEYGYIITPACNVAVNHQSRGWVIHSANNLRAEINSPDFLNYDKAIERFGNRFSYLGNAKLSKIIKRLSIGLMTVVVIYFIAHVLSLNGFLGGIEVPLNEVVCTFFITIGLLLLLPPVIPYIKSITIKSFDIGV